MDSYASACSPPRGGGRERDKPLELSGSFEAGDFIYALDRNVGVPHAHVLQVRLYPNRTSSEINAPKTSGQPRSSAGV